MWLYPPGCHIWFTSYSVLGNDNLRETLATEKSTCVWMIGRNESADPRVNTSPDVANQWDVLTLPISCHKPLWYQWCSDMLIGYVGEKKSDVRVFSRLFPTGVWSKWSTAAVRRRPVKVPLHCACEAWFLWPSFMLALCLSALFYSSLPVRSLFILPYVSFLRVYGEEAWYYMCLSKA